MLTNHKKIFAGIMAAAMILPSTSVISRPTTVSAQEILMESTFDHKIAPWEFTEYTPAKQYFELDKNEGAVHITVLEPQGSSHEKWDLQFRYKNLEFREGHEYKVKFRAKAKRGGMELCSYIGFFNDYEELFVLDGEGNNFHMGPHMGGMWAAAPVKLSTEWQEYEGVFKPTKDVVGATWTFEYAHGTQYAGNAQRGDELWFDDLSIDELGDDVITPTDRKYYTNRGSSGLENNYISVNQLGYYKGLSKIATLGDNKGDVAYDAEAIELEGVYDYEIVSTADDKVVFTGKTEKVF